ncbi:MAG: NADH-quinone oxidoreductase subunit C [Bacteroidota bacterium]
MNEMISHLKEQFSITEIKETPDGQTFVSLEAPKLIPMITSLKENHGYTILVILSAVDWLEEGKFQLTYAVNNPAEKSDLGIRVFIDRDSATMDSIHELWEHAATFQREIKEMFGIDFPGSPRVDEPFLLEGWDNTPPMRRDFDTKQYSEDTFFPRPGRETNDPAQYMKQKLYPDEQ